jgi:hypothetical protein
VGPGEDVDGIQLEHLQALRRRGDGSARRRRFDARPVEALCGEEDPPGLGDGEIRHGLLHGTAPARCAEAVLIGRRDTRALPARCGA